MLRTIGLVTSLVFFMAACGGGGAVSAPSGLQYALGTGEVGIVSGTPTNARPPLTYTVVANNLGGALTKSQLLLTVDPPPAGTAVSGAFPTVGCRAN